ncbi:MAG TPA: hypothetical protein VMC10_09495 [Stellaceae bacterium]|nr:hypothetical protein [Stellaceae bacterium]
MRAAAVTLLALSMALCGCTNAGSATDAALGSAASAGIGSGVTSATGSTLLGVAAGVGAGVGLDVGIKYIERRVHRNVQDAIAEAAGPLAVGQSARWTVEQWLPLTRKRGTVEAARDFGSAIPCKDIVFTVDGDDNLYVATVCADLRGRWRWALAEPTVDRWGTLQ